MDQILGREVNHYPRHVGDWMTATAHLTEIEECIYSRMIDQYYAREAPLPVEPAAVIRLVRAVSAAARRAVPVLLREFFVLEADGWHQKRCDEEIAAYRGKAAKASASASSRWGKRNANAYANASPNAMQTHMRTQSEGNANQNHNHNHGCTSVDNPQSSEPSAENPSGNNLPLKVNGKSTPPAGWHKTDEGIDKAGRMLGMQAKRGEDYQQYKARIFEKLGEQRS